jgi:hypothetical protein
MSRSVVFNWIRRQFKDLRSSRCNVSVWLMEDCGAAYIANPKSASSTIRNLIIGRETQKLPANQLDRKSVQAVAERRVKRTTTPAHIVRLREEFFLFSFVRNPLTRLYSCFRDKVLNAAATKRQCTLSPYGIHFGMSFDEFVQCVAAIPNHRSDQHFRSQHTFLTHKDALLVDHLGKLERFEADWGPVADQCGIACPAQRMRVSGPALAGAPLPLSRRSAELAIERYRQDIELFDYQDEVDQLVDALPSTLTASPRRAVTRRQPRLSWAPWMWQKSKRTS